MTLECEKCLIYPVKIEAINYNKEEKVVYVEVEDLYELKMVSEYFKKPLVHNETHYLVVFDKEITYRTKKEF